MGDQSLKLLIIFSFLVFGQILDSEKFENHDISFLIMWMERLHIDWQYKG